MKRTQVYFYSFIQFSRLVTLERNTKMPVLAQEKPLSTNSTILVNTAGHKGEPTG